MHNIHVKYHFSSKVMHQYTVTDQTNCSIQTTKVVSKELLKVRQEQHLDICKNYIIAFFLFSLML